MSLQEILGKRIDPLFAISIAMLFYTASEAAEEWKPEVKTLRVNNYDMAYIERGKGEPLVLVHGR